MAIYVDHIDRGIFREVLSRRRRRCSGERADQGQRQHVCMVSLKRRIVLKRNRLVNQFPLVKRALTCPFSNPFTITCDDELDRLVVSALVADDLPEAPSRQLAADLLNLGFGMMHEGLPAVGRDPETGFLAAFAVYPCSRLVAAEFPDSFMKFVSFAVRLADRLDAERNAATAGPPPAADQPAADLRMISV